jgi:hypothetical protein
MARSPYENLRPSSGGINRLMMMMLLKVSLLKFKEASAQIYEKSHSKTNLIKSEYELE